MIVDLDVKNKNCETKLSASSSLAVEKLTTTIYYLHHIVHNKLDWFIV